MRAQHMINPRQRLILRKRHQFRQFIQQTAKLLHQHRHHNQQQQHQQQQRKHHHQHRRRRTPHPVSAELFHQRVQNIGQHRSHHKRRKHIAHLHN